MTKKFLLRYYLGFTKLIKILLRLIVTFIFASATKLSAVGNNIFIKSRTAFASFITIVDNKNRLLIKCGEQFVSGAYFWATSLSLLHIKCKVSEFGHHVIVAYSSAKSSFSRLFTTSFSHISRLKIGQISAFIASQMTVTTSNVSPIIKTIVLLYSRIHTRLSDAMKVRLGMAEKLKFYTAQSLSDITRMIVGTVVRVFSKQTISSFGSCCKMIIGTVVRAFTKQSSSSLCGHCKMITGTTAKAFGNSVLVTFSSNAKSLFGQTANALKTQAFVIKNLVLTKFITTDTCSIVSSHALIDRFELTAPKNSGLSLCIKAFCGSFDCKNIFTSMAMLRKKIILSIKMTVGSIITNAGCKHLVQNSNKCVGACSLSVSFIDWEYPYYDESGALVITQVYDVDDTTSNELTLY